MLRSVIIPRCACRVILFLWLSSVLLLKSAPANDNFESRAPLNGLPVLFEGDLTGATVEPNEPLVSPGYPQRTVWLEWTAPATTPVSIWIAADWRWSVVSVFTGSSLTSLRRVPLSGVPAVFKARSGQKYLLQIGTADESGPFTLQILPPPSNDLFAAATELSGVLAYGEGHAAGASVERGEPKLNSFATRSTVWWKWRAPFSGLVVLSNMMARFPRPVGVFTGNSPGRFRRVPVVGETSEWGMVDPRFMASEGTEYHIAASGMRFPRRWEMPTWNGPIQLGLALSTLKIDAPANGATFELGTAINGSVQSVVPGDSPSLVTIVAQHASSSGSFVTTAAPPGFPFTFDLPNGYFLITATATNGSGEPMFSPPTIVRVRPPNDDFADAETIPAIPATREGHMRGAGIQPGEPGGSTDPIYGSLWWRWTAPTSGLVRVVGHNSVRLLQGEQLANLQLVAGGYGTFDFRAVRGRTYYVQVLGDQTREFIFSLSWAALNDDFADRIELTGTDVTFEAENGGATLEPGEPNPGQWGGGKSLWWSWTAPANGTLVLTRSNTFETTLVAIFHGNRLNKLQLLYVDPTADSPVRLPVQANVTYQIAIHSPINLAAALPVQLRLRFAEDSPNDAFTNAIPLVGEQVTFSGANYNASREAGEPPRDIGFHNTPVNATLWWRWTAPTSGVVNISRVGGEFAAFVEMFEGSTLDSLQSLTWNIRYFQALTSYGFTVEAGHQYFISVGGVGADRGEFEFLLQALTP